LALTIPVWHAQDDHDGTTGTAMLSGATPFAHLRVVARRLNRMLVAAETEERSSVDGAFVVLA
jgi:hypothetical protein